MYIWFKLVLCNLVLSCRIYGDCFFAPWGCFDSFRPGLRMISRFEGHKWQQTGWSSYFHCFLPGKRRENSREKRDGKKNKWIPTGKREWQQTWELSCQQKSDALHCLKERRRVFPNPGAPTWLRKPHPSAHRLPTLLQNQWDTLGSCPSFRRHRCKSCISPWWMLEHKHGATPSCPTEVIIFFF